MEKKFRKGQRIKTSGKSRTAKWGKYTGTISRVRKNTVCVYWDNCSIEDEMDKEEILHLPKAEDKGEVIPDNSNKEIQFIR